MNVLMVYPKFPDKFWSFSHALRFVGKKAAFPPLGLLTVAALLPESFQKRLVDMNVEALTDADQAQDAERNRRISDLQRVAFRSWWASQPRSSESCREFLEAAWSGDDSDGGC